MIILDSIPARYIIFRYVEDHAARLSVRTLRAHLDSERDKHRGTQGVSEVQESLLEHAAPECDSRKESKAALKEWHKMSAGLEAVKFEIASEFDSPSMQERFDVDSQSTHLYFSAEGRHFIVRVSTELDRDYSTGGLSVDLGLLAPILRSSKDGKATITTSAVYAGIKEH
jgi:hypothetical protein